MQRTNISPLLLLSLVTLLLLLTNCSDPAKNDNPVAQPYRIQSFAISPENDETYTYNIAYDINGYIKTITLTDPENSMEIQEWEKEGNTTTIWTKYNLNGNWQSDDDYQVLTYADNWLNKFEYFSDDILTLKRLFEWSNGKLISETGYYYHMNTLQETMKVAYKYSQGRLTEALYTIREGHSIDSTKHKQTIEYAGNKPSRVYHYDHNGNLATVTRLEYNANRLITIKNLNVVSGVEQESGCFENRAYDNNGNLTALVQNCYADTVLQTHIIHEKAIGTIHDMILINFGWLSMNITPNFPSLLYDFKKKSPRTAISPYQGWPSCLN